MTLLWLCLLLAALGRQARAVDDLSSPFIVDSWGVEEGLPDSEAISVIQGKDGYLWIGTLHGLVRFDGNQFTVFNQMNTPALSSDRIVFLFEDSRTDLWIGTESSGLEMMKDGAIRNFSAETSGPEHMVTYAQEDSTGNILFFAAGGLFYYHNGQMDFHPGTASPQLFSLAQHILVPSRSGGYWRLFNDRVEKMNGTRVVRNFGAFPWGDTIANVKAAIEDDQGNLIVGTSDAGIFWLQNNGDWKQVSTRQGLSSDTVLSLCLGREGNLWVGTDGGGLNRVKRKTFKTPAALAFRDAQSLSADADGGFWTAFNAAGITHWNENGTYADYGIGQASNAWTILVTRQQQVWAGTRFEGLFRLQDNQFVPVSGEHPLGPQIFALFEDHTGRLWVGAQNGLGCWNGQTWTNYSTRNGLSGNTVRAITEDTQSNLWFGTENNGLDLFKDGKFTAYRTAQNNLPGDGVSCLYADNDGGLWVGTFGHGLARFKDGNWKTLSTRSGLASDYISYIFDDAGYLWIGSNAGLMRIRKQALDDFADGKTNSIFCRTYGKADGLPTRECSIGSQPAACRTIDGTLWFPTIKGVASLKPSELKPNLQPPTVMIESVLVDGRQKKANRLASAWPSSVTVAPGGDQSKVQLEIHYTALDFSEPKLVRFKYQLEGYQSDWTEAGNERVARYPKLPPGHYRFRVMAYNEDGVPNRNSGSFEVIVLPQFWQTLWFRAGAVIFVLLLVGGIVRYISTQKLHRQLQAHQQREALERERARIARDLHDQLGANLTQVALLGEMAEADKHEPQEIESHAQQISQTARETTRSLDEIVWAINPANDTLEGLTNYAFKYAHEFLELAGVRCRVDAPSQLPPASIPPEVRHNVFLAFKEAVNNVVKHAQAAEARIRLRLEPGNFILEIADNGRGVADLNARQNRSGLRNMRKRLEDIGGRFEIAPADGGGTMVRLTVPI